MTADIYDLDIKGPKLQARVKDEKGKRYGKLVVLRFAGSEDGHGGALWLCRCDCGNTRVALGGRLRGGKLKTCGKCKKGVGSLSNAIVFGEVPLCERNCWWWDRCKEHRLACQPFATWVRTGGRVDHDLENHPPGPEIYRRLFSDEQQSEGTSG